MIGTTDHVKHVTANQSSQAKKLQAILKKVEAAARDMVKAKASAFLLRKS